MKKSYIYAIVLLVGGYVFNQALADIGATKMVQIGSVVLPAGSLAFAITFTLRDLVHKRLGKEWAKVAILVAAGFNLIQSGYLALMTKLNAPVFFANGDAWNSIFAIVPSITIASILAEYLSETIDTEVYDIYVKKFGHKFQWLRVLISNAISLPIDSLTFVLCAFVVFPMILGADAYTVKDALALGMGQITYKAIVTVVSIPLIYAVKDNKLKFATPE